MTPGRATAAVGERPTTSVGAPVRAELRRPDFLFIGPDKSGSTWLYEMLRRHPDCYVPPVKDLYFFDRHYGRGLDWYLSHFQDAPAGARAVGELSHDYLFSPAAARRIARDLPRVRLLTCLRDPVNRSFSQYLYLVRSGLVTGTFEEALRYHPEIVGNSMYGRHLRPYLELFPRERLEVLRFERLRSDAAGLARQAFGFLGLDFLPDLPYAERVLPASRPRSRLAARAMKGGARMARALGMARMVGLLKRNARLRRILYVPFRPGEKPRPSSETRARLIDLFREDVAELERMLGMDFGSWMSREEGRSEGTGAGRSMGSEDRGTVAHEEGEVT